jgi:hypothetical protein
MKTKKLNLLAFKQDELSREDFSSVKAGDPVKMKPTSTASGSGAGAGGICYYDFETGAVYCEPIEQISIPTSEL